MKQSPLAEIHNTLGAKLAEFAGWEMPIQYEGIVAEHHAVRSSAGVFDISHMGQFTATGEGVGTWLNGLLTNDLSVTTNGLGQYTLMLNDRGGVIDDLIVYRESPASYFLVVNASKIDEDFRRLTDRLLPGIRLVNESDGYGGLAVQGPKAVALWAGLAKDTPLPPRNGIARFKEVVLCRTGYTGEDGFELFAPVAEIADWFQRLIDAGAKPCGLGARDTLRLEKGFPLNGNDLDPVHTPLEAGLGFFVKLKTDLPFVGRKVLEQQKESGVKERLVGLAMIGKTPPPRHGYDLINPVTGEKISELSSGGLSPTLGKGIAMAYVPVEFAKIGTKLEIGIRQKNFPAEVVKKPFV